MMCASLSISSMCPYCIYSKWLTADASCGVDYLTDIFEVFHFEFSNFCHINSAIIILKSWVITQLKWVISADSQPEPTDQLEGQFSVFFCFSRVQRRLMSLAIATKCEEKNPSTPLSCFLFTETTHMNIIIPILMCFFLLAFSCVCKASEATNALLLNLNTRTITKARICVCLCVCVE